MAGDFARAGSRTVALLLIGTILAIAVEARAQLSNPVGVAIEAGAGTALVTTQDALVRVNLSTLQPTSTITSGLSVPTGVVIETGGRSALALTLNTLLRVDLTTGATQTIATGLSFPYGLALEAGGTTALVTDRTGAFSGATGRLLRIDLSTGAITAILSPSSGLNAPRGVAIEAGGATVLVAEQGAERLVRVNLASGAITAVSTELVPAGFGSFGASGVVIEPGGATALVTGQTTTGNYWALLARIDLARGTVTWLTNPSCCNAAFEAIALEGDGTTALVADRATGRLVRVSTRSAVRKVAPSRRSLERFSNAMAVAIEAGGATALVTDLGSSARLPTPTGRLLRVDLATGILTPIVSSLKVPRGIAIESGGATALVADQGWNSVFDPDGQLLRVDLGTGVMTPIADHLRGPTSAAIEQGGATALVTSFDGVARIDLASGTSTRIPLAGPPGFREDNLGSIAIEAGGATALMAERAAAGLVRVDLATGIVTTVAPKLTFVDHSLVGFAIEPGGATALVANEYRLLRVSLATGRFTVLTSSLELAQSVAIELGGATALVSEWASSLVRVELASATSAASVSSVVQGLTMPASLVVEQSGVTALLLDCVPSSGGSCDTGGRLLRLDVVTGEATVLATGFRLGGDFDQAVAVETPVATALVADCGPQFSSCSTAARIMRVNLATGARELIASGFNLVSWIEVEAGARTALVAERGTGRLLRLELDPAMEGAFSIVATGLDNPLQIHIEDSGRSAVVATSTGLVRVNLQTGVSTPIAPLQWSRFAVEPGGRTALVTGSGDLPSVGYLTRVDLISGAVSVLHDGRGFFGEADSMVVEPGGATALVVEGRRGTGTVLRFNVPAASISPGVTGSVTVAATGTGTGRITSEPGGIDCGDDCSESYAGIVAVTLAASADPGFIFSGWSGACSGTGTCTVVADGPKAVTAAFARRTFTLTVTFAGTGQGTVSAPGLTCSGTIPSQSCTGTFEDGSSVTITPSPGTQSGFTGWSGGGCAGTGACTVAVSANTSAVATFDLLFTLNVSRFGIGAGVVTGTGIHCGLDCVQELTSGTTVVLTATPASGSTFDGWFGCDTVSGTTCTITMQFARFVSAGFTVAQPVTLTVSRAGNGTVTSTPSGINCGNDCAESYDGGTTVTLTPTASSGSTFGSWSGCQSVTGVTCTVVMSADRMVTANFVPLPRFTLTVQRAGQGSGTVTSIPSGVACGIDCTESYPSGTVAVLTATPVSGSTFSGWTNCPSAAGPMCTVTMDASRTVTASFARVVLRPLVVIKPRGIKPRTGDGTVTSNPAGISCGNDCRESYASGTVVELSATPAPNAVFVWWRGACSGTGPCIVTMSAAKTVMAVFLSHTLRVRRSGGGVGVVTAAPGARACPPDCMQPYAPGTVVDLAATPAADATFMGWSGVCRGTGECRVTMNAARTVTASFVRNAFFALNVGRTGIGSGTVRSVAAGIDCGSDCTENYRSDATVQLTAVPEPGSTFTGWTGACTGTGTCTVAMNAAKAVTATFTVLPRFTLTVQRSGTGSGSVTSAPDGIACGGDCTESYLSGTSVSLTATPAADSSFTGWSGACTGTGTCRVTMTAARSVTATFASQTLQVAKSGSGSGRVVSDPTGVSCGNDCQERYSPGTVVRLYASPDPGSAFTGWAGACSGIGTCTVSMTAARSVMATFAPGDSLLAGWKPFVGPLPPFGAVTYRTKTGEHLTIDPAYPGLVVLFVDPATAVSTIESTIQANGGAIVSALPRAGQYIVEIPPSQEEAFLSAMYEEAWVKDGAPATPSVRGAIVALDWDGGRAGDACNFLHGSLVREVAQRRGSSVTLVDVESEAKLPSPAAGLVPRMIQEVEAAKRTNTRVVLNMSLASPECGRGSAPGDIAACGTDWASAVRAQQYTFYRHFLGTLEEKLKIDRTAADNVLLVMIAGNAGVSLDSEITRLKTDFPNAFERLQIVGGATATGDLVYNQLTDNRADSACARTHPAGACMVYARAEAVEIGPNRCSGTSFAAPEVSSLLDAIWTANPTLTSAQLNAVFKTALREIGTNNRLPQDGTGRTPQSFIDGAVEISREPLPLRETYRGTATMLDVHTFPSSCTPNPRVLTSTTPPFEITIEVDGSLRRAGTFTATFHTATVVETTEFPPSMCGDVSVPGSTSTTTFRWLGDLSGTSDGSRVTFVDPDPLNDTYTMTGMVSGDQLTGRYEGTTILGPGDSFRTTIDFTLTRIDP